MFNTTRLTVTTAACSFILLLSACTPGALAPAETTAPSSTSPAVTPDASSPAPTVTPTATPAATQTPAPNPTGASSSEWKTVTVDNWATVTVPDGWEVESYSAIEDPNDPFYAPLYGLVDESGKQQVSFNYARPKGDGSNAPEAGSAWQPSPYTLVEATPLETLPEENLHHVLTVREVQTYVDGQEAVQYQVASRVVEADRVGNPSCEPLSSTGPVTVDGCEPPSAAYPANGGYFWIAVHQEPLESLFFDTEQEALDYTMTDEYQTAKKVIESVQITL